MKLLRLLVVAVAAALLPLPSAAQQTSFAKAAAVDGTGTTVLVVPGVSGKRTYVCGWDLSVPASTTMAFENGVTALTGPLAAALWQKPLVSAPCYFVTAPGADLNVAVSPSGHLAGVIWYYQQ